MPKRKKEQFAENETFRHVIQPLSAVLRADEFEWKGNWSEFFGNENPIVLELGCGKGEYSVNLGKRYPDRNYIGVDVKGARIWRGAKTVQEEQIPNVAFLRTRIDFIALGFAPGEVSEIWLTFSDPMKGGNENRRLTSKVFIDRYRNILQPDAVIHLKTDSDLLYEFTLEQIAEHGYTLLEKSDDIYRDMAQFDPELQFALQIQTHYEKKFLAVGKNINYCRFRI
jgi:tRNA (guanine-N7-)-methyltransferase